MCDLCMIGDGRSGGNITISSSSIYIGRCIYLIHILIMDFFDHTQKRTLYRIGGMYVQLQLQLKG